MGDFFTGPVFEVELERFSWRDVALFAHAASRWDDVLRDLTDGLACQEHAEREEDESLEEAVDEAAAEFRYARELITAAEAEAWLAARGVTVAEWLGTIRREVLRREWATALADLRLLYPPAPSLLADALRAELACTATGTRLATRAAEEVAAAVAAGTSLSAAGAPAADLPDPLPLGLDPGHARQRLPLVMRVRDGAARFSAQLLTAEALGREIRSHQMDWVRMECQAVAFAEAAQAREAVLCLKEDGLEIAEVARSAHLEPEHTSFYLDELDPVLQPVFLSAMPGDVLGPTPRGDQHTVFQVLSKRMPDDADPGVRQRAAQRLAARALAAEVERRVRWLADW